MRYFVALLILLSLAACGGGGGGGGGAAADPPPVVNPPPPTPPPVDPPPVDPPPVDPPPVDPPPVDPPPVDPPPVDPPPPPPPPPVTVSGVLTYDFVPHALAGGLDFGATRQDPVIGVTVQALSSTDTVLSTTVSGEDGSYSLEIPSTGEFRIRALAERVKTGTPAWDVSVLDNTATGEPMYAMESAPVVADGDDIDLSLNAPSGWTGGSYTEARVAAPFAILESIRLAEQKLLSVAPDVVFPPLLVGWSPNNIESDEFNPEIGEIITTFAQDDRIYVLGDASTDTDEYDPHVLIHEWAHYYEDNLSRVDSPGGEHAQAFQLDLRVAFSEGWGNAWAAIVLDDPQYRDTGRPDVPGDTYSFDIDEGLTSNEGWYSEATIGGLLWDIYDDDNAGLDTVSLGLAPIDAVLRGPQVATPALTSIYTFLFHLKEQEPTLAAVLDAMAEARDIASTGQDIWGSTETNDGGEAEALPIYLPLVVDGPPVVACTRATSTEYDNRIGNRRFLRVTIDSAGTYSFQAEGTVDASPELLVWTTGDVDGPSTAAGGLAALELALQPGERVIEVYDTRNLELPVTGDICFDVTATTVQ